MIRPRKRPLRYLEILPRLARGVLVARNDVFTPRDYPSDGSSTSSDSGMSSTFGSISFLQLAVPRRGCHQYLWHSHRPALVGICPMLRKPPRRAGIVLLSDPDAHCQILDAHCQILDAMRGRASRAAEERWNQRLDPMTRTLLQKTPPISDTRRKRLASNWRSSILTSGMMREFVRRLDWLRGLQAYCVPATRTVCRRPAVAELRRIPKLSC